MYVVCLTGHTCVCMCIHVYMWRVYVYGCTFAWIHGWVACCSVSDPFGEIRTHCRRFRFVPVMDLLEWRFKDRPMGWSEDAYWFVQWRPDNDSNPNRVISCEYFFLCHFLIYCCQKSYICYLFYFKWPSALLYRYDYPYYLCDTSECSLWLYSLSECLSVSFHVLIVWHYWPRTCCGITLD